MSRSICQCARCSNQENDMIYIEIHDEWYCTECHENDRIWYPTHGSAENRWQNDYINMYYEQKEKFEKIFHIRFLIRRFIRLILNRNI